MVTERYGKGATCTHLYRGFLPSFVTFVFGFVVWEPKKLQVLRGAATGDATLASTTGLGAFGPTPT